jgi:cell division septation protein DedD
MDLPVERSATGENRLCRIMVGPFPNRREARFTADKIYKDTGLDYFLVPQVHTPSADCLVSNN